MNCTYQDYVAARDAGFEDDPQTKCPVCGEGRHFAEELGAAFEAIERARVVGVIDAFKRANPQWSEISGANAAGGYRFRCGPICIDRDSADEARAAAAKAIEAGEV